MSCTTSKSAAPGAQQPPGPQREGERLGEAGGHHRRHLEHIDPVPVLVAAGHAERIRLPVEVQAGHLDEADAVVEHREGLPGEDIDLVAEPGELPAEVAHVDALAAAEWVALVREQGNPQWFTGQESSSSRLRQLLGNMQHKRPMVLPPSMACHVLLMELTGRAYGRVGVLVAFVGPQLDPADLA